MTLTPQQLAAVAATRDFLVRLSKPSEGIRQWRPMRTEARALLRQFPLEEELERALGPR